MDTKVKRLFEIRELVNEADVPEFSALCEELAEEGDPAVLPDVFKVFTDRTQHHEVMVDLQGVVESFPPDVYVTALTAALPSMLADAREWAKQLLRTIMQSPTHAQQLRAARAASSAADRKTTAPLFTEIADETPQVRNVALELSKI
jgi:dienelactone hydrolase